METARENRVFLELYDTMEAKEKGRKGTDYGGTVYSV